MCLLPIWCFRKLKKMIWGSNPLKIECFRKFILHLSGPSLWVFGLSLFFYSNFPTSKFYKFLNSSTLRSHNFAEKGYENMKIIFLKNSAMKLSVSKIKMVWKNPFQARNQKFKTFKDNFLYSKVSSWSILVNKKLLSLQVEQINFSTNLLVDFK